MDTILILTPIAIAMPLARSASRPIIVPSFALTWRGGKSCDVPTVNSPVLTIRSNTGPARALAEKSNVRVMAKKSDLKILLMILLLFFVENIGQYKPNC